MLDGMSDSIQGSRIENLQSREVDRQSPTGLIFLRLNLMPQFLAFGPLRPWNIPSGKTTSQNRCDRALASGFF